MKKNKYYAFLYFISVSLFLGGCGLENESSLKVPEPTVCPKVDSEYLSLRKKNLNISIDKVVMIMPEEEKKEQEQAAGAEEAREAKIKIYLNDVEQTGNEIVLRLETPSQDDNKAAAAKSARKPLPLEAVWGWW